MKRIFSAALLGLAIALTGCTQIDTGNVGVESTVGQVKPDELAPGVYFTLFKKVTEVSTKELPLQLNDLRPQTSDKITLADLDVDIYVQIAPDKAADMMTRFAGDVIELKGEEGVRVGNNYVTRQAREAVYTAMAKRGSATVHTERAELAANIVQSLQAELDGTVGKGWFFVRSANVRNLVTDPALEAQIKAAAQAQFQMQAEENKLKNAKIIADRLRVEAQGEADAIAIKAQAVAKQGGAEYVQLQAIQKWDGKLPTTQAGGVTPFLSVK
jgi:hypothetical protein